MGMAPIWAVDRAGVSGPRWRRVQGRQSTLPWHNRLTRWLKPDGSYHRLKVKWMGKACSYRYARVTAPTQVRARNRSCALDAWLPMLELRVFFLCLGDDRQVGVG